METSSLLYSLYMYASKLWSNIYHNGVGAQFLPELHCHKQNEGAYQRRSSISRVKQGSGDGMGAGTENSVETHSKYRRLHN